MLVLALVAEAGREIKSGGQLVLGNGTVGRAREGGWCNALHDDHLVRGGTRVGAVDRDLARGHGGGGRDDLEILEGDREVRRGARRVNRHARGGLLVVATGGDARR